MQLGKTTRVLLRAALAFCLAAGISSRAQSNIQVAESAISLLDALKAALEKSPNIQLEQAQLLSDRGALRIASGQFDRIYKANLSHSYTNTPVTPLQQLQTQGAGIVNSFQVANLSSFEVGAQQLLRNGISISPVLGIDRQTDNIVDTRGVSTSNLSFQVTVPLLRGRGREVVTAGERAARFNADATMYQLNQTIAQQLTAAASAYWNVVAARLDLTIARSSEDRGLNFASMVQTLIDADRVPRVEINNVSANVSQRTAERIAAEAGLYNARQQLALAIGVSRSDITTFPVATDEMPNWVSTGIPEVTPQLMESFVDRAVHRRPDLLAANEHYKSSEALAPAARNQLRPQVDMSFALGYQGLLDGRNYLRIFAAPFNHVGGPTATAGLQYSFPPSRNAAAGAVAQAEAQIRQARVGMNDLSRTVASQVASAMISVASAVTRVRTTREAVAAARRALDGENEKFRLGRNALIDLLTVEDRLTTALHTENTAHLDYALAVVTLRYATGTIVEPAAAVHTIDQTLFTTPPFGWEQ